MATITTDTGAFAPGHRNFSRYNTPGLCRAAARWTHNLARRSLAAQIRSDSLNDDTTGTGQAAAVARSCGAHFTLASTSARTLDDMFDLALHEQNDSLSLAALAKLVAQAKTEDERDAYWSDAMQEYMQFGRLAAAEALLPRLDAQGPAARKEQVWLHALLMWHFDFPADSTRIRQEAERVIALGRKEGKVGYYLLEKSANALLMQDALWEGHSAALPALAQRAQRFLSAFNAEDQKGSNQGGYIDWGRLPLDSVIDHLTPGYVRYRWTRNHTPAPHLQADYWFPTPRSQSNDTVRPVRGRINLICVGGEPIFRFLDQDGEQPGRELHSERINNAAGLKSGAVFGTNLRHWLAQYGAAGLVVTVVGMVDNPLKLDDTTPALHLRFLTPAEQAQQWRWYYQDYEQLPVAVAVQVKRTTAWLPPPDGRRLSEADLQYDKYLNLNEPKGSAYHAAPGACTVIDLDGGILFSSEGAFIEFPKSIDVVLAWLFTGPGASGAVLPSALGPTRAAPPAASPSASLSPRGNPL